MRGDSPDGIAKAIDTYIGQRIRGRRLQLKMSQGTLGDRIGVTFQQVQKYENGKHSAAAPRLVLIAEALDVSVAFFFEDLPR
jgi:transcriptional regulator with XRE-family HTH domain